MTTRITLFVTLVSLTLATSSVSASLDHATMLGQLDQVCSWTGLRRLGDLKHIEYWQQGQDAGCKAKLFLAVEDRRAEYSIEFRRERGQLKLWAFIPPDSVIAEKDSDWRGFKGIGYDTLKDRHARAFALAAVKKLNKHLNWHWFSGPLMQKIGHNIQVSFETVSREQLNEPHGYLRHMDPYVTFIVSSKGTVIAAWFGV